MKSRRDREVLLWQGKKRGGGTKGKEAQNGNLISENQDRYLTAPNHLRFRFRIHRFRLSHAFTAYPLPHGYHHPRGVRPENLLDGTMPFCPPSPDAIDLA
jgi:hypothetical protein